MNTAVIITKTEPATKKQAQRIASELGVSLSSIINAYLRQFVRTKRIEFDLKEEPSDYLLRSLKESQEDVKEGRVSPKFSNAEDAIKWLNNPKAKYQNGDTV